MGGGNRMKQRAQREKKTKDKTLYGESRYVSPVRARTKLKTRKGITTPRAKNETSPKALLESLPWSNLGAYMAAELLLEEKAKVQAEKKEKGKDRRTKNAGLPALEEGLDETEEADPGSEWAERLKAPTTPLMEVKVKPIWKNKDHKEHWPSLGDGEEDQPQGAEGGLPWNKIGQKKPPRKPKPPPPKRLLSPRQEWPTLPVGATPEQRKSPGVPGVPECWESLVDYVQPVPQPRDRRWNLDEFQTVERKKSPRKSRTSRRGGTPRKQKTPPRKEVDVNDGAWGDSVPPESTKVQFMGRSPLEELLRQNEVRLPRKEVRFLDLKDDLAPSGDTTLSFIYEPTTLTSTVDQPQTTKQSVSVNKESSLCDPKTSKNKAQTKVYINKECSTTSINKPQEEKKKKIIECSSSLNEPTSRNDKAQTKVDINNDPTSLASTSPSTRTAINKPQAKKKPIECSSSLNEPTAPPLHQPAAQATNQSVDISKKCLGSLNEITISPSINKTRGTKRNSNKECLASLYEPSVSPSPPNDGLENSAPHPTSSAPLMTGLGIVPPVPPMKKDARSFEADAYEADHEGNTDSGRSSPDDKVVEPIAEKPWGLKSNIWTEKRDTSSKEYRLWPQSKEEESKPVCPWFGKRMSRCESDDSGLSDTATAPSRKMSEASLRDDDDWIHGADRMLFKGTPDWIRVPGRTESPDVVVKVPLRSQKGLDADAPAFEPSVMCDLMPRGRSVLNVDALTFNPSLDTDRLLPPAVPVDALTFNPSLDTDRLLPPAVPVNLQQELVLVDLDRKPLIPLELQKDFEKRVVNDIEKMLQQESDSLDFTSPVRPSTPPPPRPMPTWDIPCSPKGSLLTETLPDCWEDVVLSPIPATPRKASPIKAIPIKTTPLTRSPIEATTIKPSPIKVTPIKATPTEAAPVKATSTEATPIKVVPIKATPIKATPIKATPTEATPTEVTPTEVTPTNATPTEATPTEATPIKATSTEATPIKPSPIKASPAKRNSSSFSHKKPKRLNPHARVFVPPPPPPSPLPDFNCESFRRNQIRLDREAAVKRQLFVDQPKKAPVSVKINRRRSDRVKVLKQELPASLSPFKPRDIATANATADTIATVTDNNLIDLLSFLQPNEISKPRETNSAVLALLDSAAKKNLFELEASFSSNLNIVEPVKALAPKKPMTAEERVKRRILNLSASILRQRAIVHERQRRRPQRNHRVTRRMRRALDQINEVKELLLDVQMDSEKTALMKNANWPSSSKKATKKRCCKALAEVSKAKDRCGYCKEVVKLALSRLWGKERKEPRSEIAEERAVSLPKRPTYLQKEPKNNPPLTAMQRAPFTFSMRGPPPVTSRQRKPPPISRPPPPPPAPFIPRQSMALPQSVRQMMVRFPPPPPVPWMVQTSPPRPVFVPPHVVPSYQQVSSYMMWDGHGWKPVQVAGSRFRWLSQIVY